MSGHVFLVGAGPGDPGLLTLRAKELIEAADVIIYDRLVSSKILDFADDNTKLVYVGKRPGRHPVPQDEINQLLIAHAQAGRMVVRLKGGDPFIFGRGGEEADELRANSIPVEIVPGITAAQGAAASLGVPLTQRGANTSVRYITGHLREDANPDSHDWVGLTDEQTTLVIYMGLSSIDHFVRRLLMHGRSGETPAIAVSNATSPEQRYVKSTLNRLADETEDAGFDGPVLFIIGEVVGLAEHLEMKRETYEDLSFAVEAFVAAQ